MSPIRCSIRGFDTKTIHKMPAVADSTAADPVRPPAPQAGARARLLKNPTVVIGAAILAIILAIGLAAPWLDTVDPAAINPAVRNKGPGFVELARNADGTQTAIA